MLLRAAQRPLVRLLALVLLTSLIPPFPSPVVAAAPSAPQAVPPVAPAPAPLAPPVGSNPVPQPKSHPTSSPAHAGLTPPRAADFGKLPLSFIPNMGQADSAMRFQARGVGGALFFTPNEVVLAVAPPPSENAGAPSSSGSNNGSRTPTATPTPTPPGGGQNATDGPRIVRIRFDGADAAPAVTGLDRLSGTANSFVGNNPAAWRADLPTYAGIGYAHLYPGIDLHYDGLDGQLKGTYTVAPGADPTLVRWRYVGVQDVHVDATTGNLLISLPGSQANQDNQTLIEHAPVAWQDINGQRVPVALAEPVARSVIVSRSIAWGMCI